MTTQPFGPQPFPYQPVPADQDRCAWVAPTIATVLLALLAPAAALFGGLSFMATDSCGPDDCPQALMTSLTLIYGLLYFGGWFSFGTYLAAWLLPWKRRWSAWRACLAVVSLLPPLFVVMLVFSLPEP